MFNSVTAVRAINKRWDEYRAIGGETINEASVRLNTPVRTLKRWKAQGKVVMEDRLWVVRSRVAAAVPSSVNSTPVVVVQSTPVDVPVVVVPVVDDEEIEDGAKRLNISLRTAYSWRDTDKLVLDNGLWTVR